jgi:N-acetylmuramoyl-L-alanine amidase
MKISRKSRGEQVSDIQRRLMKLGYDLGITGPDGVFGPKTEEAIRDFQRKHTLPENGCVDDLTWKKLVEESYELGERLLYLHHPFFRGRDVRDLQRLLQSLGFNPGILDGIFGPKTEKAVKEFQRSTGLIVDGIVGLKTLEELKRMGAGGEVDIEFPRRELKIPLPQGFKVAVDVNSDESIVSLAIDIAERLGKLLMAHEALIFHLRSREETISEDEKIKAVNESGAHIFVGINFISSNREFIEVCYFQDKERYSRKGRKLASLIHEEILNVVEHEDLELQGKPLKILRRTRMPAVIINFFIFTQLGKKVPFSDSALRQRVAGAILEGIKKYARQVE